MKSFPFTFDQTPGPLRRLILTEKGTMAAYLAAGHWTTEAVGCVALRCVVLMHTTDVDLRLIYPDHSKWGVCKDLILQSFEIVSPYITSSVKILTKIQQTPEWFLLRKFRITGTGAFSAWKIISARSGGELVSGNVEAVIRFLSCLASNNNEQPAVLERDDEHYVAATLQGKTLPELQTMCQEKRLPAGFWN